MFFFFFFFLIFSLFLSKFIWFFFCFKMFIFLIVGLEMNLKSILLLFKVVEMFFLLMMIGFIMFKNGVVSIKFWESFLIMMNDVFKYNLLLQMMNSTGKFMFYFYIWFISSSNVLSGFFKVFCWNYFFFNMI